MKVWIVNPFDSLPAEGSRPLRYWLMAEAFARAGHSVVYWTADFNHATKTPRTESAWTVPASETGAIEVVAVHEPVYRKNVSLRRIFAHWRWAKNWYRAACGLCGDGTGNPDLIISSSPPLFIGKMVLRFARKSGAKTIIDVMDAWPETFERVVPKFFTWPLRRLAKSNYLGADAVTAVADNYVELVGRYGRHRDVRRFYHGISLETSLPGFATGGRGAGSVVKIVYAGNMGVSYDLATAVEAVALLNGAVLEIAGKGGCEEKLKTLAASLGLREKIVFKGYLDANELEEFLAGGDIGLVPMSPESFVGVPYKFADYAKAGLAIASSLGGESAKLMAKYGCGAAYRPGDPQSLAEAVKRMVPRLAEMKKGARRMAEEEFDAQKIYGDYLAFAESVIGNRL